MVDISDQQKLANCLFQNKWNPTNHGAMTYRASSTNLLQTKQLFCSIIYWQQHTILFEERALLLKMKKISPRSPTAFRVNLHHFWDGLLDSM